MRHWILSFCFLISAKLLLACGGWSPFGEEVRFSLLHPQMFDDGGMRPFYYSADYIYDYYEHNATSDRNVDDWWRFAQGEVGKEEVFDAVYRLTSQEINDPKSTHPFVVQLRKQGAQAELDYLAFAKRYSHLNSTWSDPWEREDRQVAKKRSAAIKKAMKLVKLATSESLKRRYAFQALRLAFYNGQLSDVADLYTRYFEGKDEWIIDKWAHYYHLHSQPQSAEVNFELTQLFAEIPTKRFGIFSLFDWGIKKTDVLALAQSDKERANVLAMYAIRQQARGLTVLEEINRLDPHNALLPALLVRELNKVEDWVLGPTYTTYAPVMRPGLDSYSADNELIRSAAIEDRLYAGQLLTWLVAHRQSIEEELFLSLKGSLEFCTGDSEAALRTLKTGTFKRADRETWRQRMIGMLQVANGADVTTLDMTLYLKDEYAYKDRFLFMLGRLCEYRGDLGQALFMYAQLNKSGHDWSGFTWAEPKGYTMFNMSFYNDYFDYFDPNYSAKELSDALDYVKEIKVAHKGKVLGEMAAFMDVDDHRLKDLMGTKYFREDNLAQALNWFKQVPDSYWKSDDQYYAHYLAANPFYANFYSAHAKTDGDTISYTKYQLVKKLDQLIASAEKQSGSARARTLYHIANCYFNMTTHGNSWMMRRSWWSSYVYNTIYVDNEEYTQCVKAQEYYMKAYEAAESGKIKALCLRMAGRCEGLELLVEEEYDYERDYKAEGGYEEYLFKKNSYYKRLKREFPQFQEELFSDCHSFNRYYRAL